MWVLSLFASSLALHTGRMAANRRESAFVTEASGFIGLELVKVLVARGHDVFGLTQSVEAARRRPSTRRRSPPSRTRSSATRCSRTFDCAGSAFTGDIPRWSRDFSRYSESSMSDALSPPSPAAAIVESFDDTVVPNLDAARRLAQRLLRNEHDADDVVQEESLRALRYFRTFSGGSGRAWFSPWTPG